MSVTFEGDDVYTVDAADGEKGLTAENRIQYTTLGNILNVPVNAEVDVTFHRKRESERFEQSDCE